MPARRWRASSPAVPTRRSDKLPLLLMGALATCRRRVAIITPYFLPSETIISALIVAALRGIDVELVVPAHSNILPMDWAMQALWKPLVDHGVRVTLTPPPFDHSKVMVVDGTWVLIGSTNWDVRSLRLNFEANLECHDPQLAARLEAYIEAKRAEGHRLTRDDVHATPLALQMRNRLVHLFCILSLIPVDAVFRLSPVPNCACGTGPCPKARRCALAHLRPKHSDPRSAWSVGTCTKSSAPVRSPTSPRSARTPILVLLQEAVLHGAQPHPVHISSGLEWVMAQTLGHARRGITTGPKTGCRAPALEISTLRTSDNEPIVNTPKTSLLTRYATANGTLTVINVHAMNFVPLAKFARQIEQIAGLATAESGPLLVAGDFNTWNPARHRLLATAMNTAGLAHVPVTAPRRWRHFGQQLDHVFVRGLKVIEARPLVHIVSSDHIPLRVDLALA